MRVLFVFSTLGVGGAERQASQLIPGLRARGLDPSVLSLRHGGRFADVLRAAGIDVTLIGMRSRWDIIGAWRAYRHWRDRPDVILSQSVDAQIVAQAISYRSGAPHVTIDQGGPGILKGRHRQLMTRAVSRRVDRVIAVSLSQLPGLTRLGYRKEAVRVIPNGAAGTSPVIASAAVRESLAIEADAFVALLIATLRPEKRAAAFVRGVIAAHARNPAVRGVVVGGGPDLAQITALASASAGIVTVLGEREDIPDLIGCADCVCLTSVSEGTPLSVIEGMSQAKPIVATAVGGLREAVLDGATGILVTPGDESAFAEALLALADNEDLRSQLGAEGKRRFETLYTLDAMVDAYVDVIREVVPPKERRR